MMTNAAPSDQGIKRELSLGEVLSKTFQLYRQDFSKYFPLFAIVGVATGILNALAESYFVLPRLPANPTPQQTATWLSSFFATEVLLIGAVFLISIVFFPITQGTAIKMASQQITMGRASFGESFRVAVSRILSFWALSIILGIILFFGFLAFIIPGIILAIMFVLSYPVLIIENKGVLESLGRSRQLVSHRWLQTFATLFILGIISIVASLIVSAIGAPFGFARAIVTGVLSAFYFPLFPILVTVYYYSSLARIARGPSGQWPSATPPGTQPAGLKTCPICAAQVTMTAMFCPTCGHKFGP